MYKTLWNFLKLSHLEKCHSTEQSILFLGMLPLPFFKCFLSLQSYSFSLYITVYCKDALQLNSILHERKM